MAPTDPVQKRARARAYEAQKRRLRTVTNRARELARSGQYADSQSVIAELAAMEGFEDARALLDDSALCTQLDRLCALARQSGEAN